MSDFSSIRPYQDAEVKPTLERLVNTPELLHTLIGFRYPKLSGWRKSLLAIGLKAYLRWRLRNIDSVYQFQLEVESYMDHMIKTTTSELSSSGLDSLDLSQPHLFISNHRDIALDPAFVSYILHHSGQDTVQIAIGDNLLTKPWVSDLMRLNRSFIVKRSASTKRDKLKNSRELSAYIHHAITELGDHIWIAQREGRAKDGVDLTNAALISMLSLNRSKSQPFSEFIKQLNIVPVSISYEFDPCDEAKANELVAQQQGHYAKQEHEDILSISRGITGHKGRVHLHFSPALQGEYHSAKQVAEELDRAIIGNYQLMPTNWVAAGRSEQASLNPRDVDHAQRYFEAKASTLSAEAVEQLLAMYANPVLYKDKVV